MRISIRHHLWRRRPLLLPALALGLALPLLGLAQVSLLAPASARVQARLLADGCSPKTAKAKVTVDATNALKFSPAKVCLKKGGKVTWRNTGSVSHTTTDEASLAANAKDAELPTGATGWNHTLSPGKSWSHKFTVVGTYKYFCIPHEQLGMLGKIVVVK